jgi:hypothetical protein
MIRAVWSRLLDGPSRLGWSAMPWTMRIGAWTSAIIDSGGLLVIPFAALNIGTYSIDNQRVSGPHFLIHGYLEWVPFLALSIAIAYGYRTERMWARTLPIFFWLAVDGDLAWQVFVGDIASSDVIEIGFSAVLYVAIALWYCWFKRSVELYYRALGEANSLAHRLSSDVASA